MWFGFARQMAFTDYENTPPAAHRRLVSGGGLRPISQRLAGRRRHHHFGNLGITKKQLGHSGWFFWPLAALLARYRSCGYAPRERLASSQNSCAIIAQVVFS
jgi:hypothetical protein